MICMKQCTFILINPTSSKKARTKILTIQTQNTTIEDIFYLNGRPLTKVMKMHEITLSKLRMS
jgi:hypothetical protein